MSLFTCSPLAKEADAAEALNAAKPINGTPVGAEETTVYIDKIIAIREVTSLDIGRVSGDSQVIEHLLPPIKMIVYCLLFFIEMDSC